MCAKGAVTHEREEVNANSKLGYAGVAIAALCSAITCGVTFLFALYRQLALVEVAASIALGVELYFLSSAVGELIEKREAPKRWKMWTAMSLAGLVVIGFSVAKRLQ